MERRAPVDENQRSESDVGFFNGSLVVQPIDATLSSFWKDGVSPMKYRYDVFFTDKQKSEIWDR
jgi:hypothetical protein